MRSLAFTGVVASAVLLAAAPVAAADSGRVARAPANGQVGVPDISLRPPLGAPGMHAPRTSHPGGWTPGGWSYHGGGERTGWQGRRWGGSSWTGGNWSRGNWSRYHRPRRGSTLPRYWIAPSFVVSNWSSYGLAEPGYGRNWVRYYDDAVLVDGGGSIYDVRYGIDWDRYDHGPVPEYVGNGDNYDYDYGYDGHDDAVAWGWRVPSASPYPPLVYYAPPGTTTFIVQSSPVVTTTTTTFVEEEIVHHAPKKAWTKPKPKKAWKPSPPSCCCICR